HMWRYDATFGQLERLPWAGDAPAPFPDDPDKLVFVRSQAAAKVDAPGEPASIDPTEVVIGDLTTRVAHIVIPASTSQWKDLAVSPDGKHLALVSDRGATGNALERWRVFLVDLPGGEPRPLTKPATAVGSLCWTPDSKSLLYERSHKTLPPDYWEVERYQRFVFFDLFQWDLATSQETRLSRGGCLCPTVTTAGQLFFLVRDRDESGFQTWVQTMELDEARAFARQEPELPVRDAAAWEALIDEVVKETGVPTGSSEVLTPEMAGQLAASFARLYHDRF